MRSRFAKLVVVVVVGVAWVVLAGGCRRLAKRALHESDEQVVHHATGALAGNERHGGAASVVLHVAPAVGIRQAEPKDLSEADGIIRGSTHAPSGAHPYGASSDEVSLRLAIDQARDDARDTAADRDPESVLRVLTEYTASGRPPSPAVRTSLVQATQRVGTPAAAAHVAHVLAHGLALENAGGKLVVWRGKLVLSRDVEELQTIPVARLPPTELGQRDVFVDSRLYAGREGLLPDLGDQVARWQQHRDVHISELRLHPVGLLPERLVETSTGTVFHHIPPRRNAVDGRELLPIVIHAGKVVHREQRPQHSDGL